MAKRERAPEALMEEGEGELVKRGMREGILANSAKKREREMTRFSRQGEDTREGDMRD
jgi:hypothetical protein